MRPGAGHHKVAERLRERHHRRPCVAGFRAFAGDNDRPGVHRFGGNPGGLVLRQNQRLEFGLLQTALLINRGKEDRALPANFAFDEFVARHLRHRRTVNQLKAGEDHLSGGGADIDTDAQQLASFHDCASASVFAAAGALSSFGTSSIATPMAVTPPISLPTIIGKIMAFMLAAAKPK